MASNIGEIRDKVGARIKDSDARLSVSPPLTCDVDRAIYDALAQYQRARPLEKAVKIDGTGVFDYDLAASGFVDGFSTVKDVAYPYLVTDQRLAVLDRDEWALIRLDTGVKLRFFEAIPPASDDFLVLLTVPHTLNASTSTVPASDDEALADLGAAFACDQLAALYAKDTDSSLAADAVDRRAKSENYRSQAASYRKSYAAKMETDEAQSAAFAMADIDRTFGNSRGDDYFFHGRARF